MARTRLTVASLFIHFFRVSGVGIPSPNSVSTVASTSDSLIPAPSGTNFAQKFLRKEGFTNVEWAWAIKWPSEVFIIIV